LVNPNSTTGGPRASSCAGRFIFSEVAFAQIAAENFALF
jgi:hypothetical protein